MHKIKLFTFFIAGFLNNFTIDNLDQIILCCGDLSCVLCVYCEIFNSILGLYPLDTSCVTWVSQPKLSPDITLEGKMDVQMRTSDLYILPDWLSDFTFSFHFHALEKEMATHSSVLAWRIPRTGEPGGLPSHRVGHDWSDLAAAAAAAAAWLIDTMYHDS